MEPELPSSYHPLEKRLDLLRRLASEQEHAQTALLRSDLQAMESHTARQQELCEALRAHPALTPASPLPEGPESAVWQERWNLLRMELEGVENQVRHLNRVHAGLLRRACHALTILNRVLSSFSNTYVPPEPRESATTTR